jgi:D-amino-acid dehydrogenase
VVSRGSILPMASPAFWGKLPAYLRNADRRQQRRRGPAPARGARGGHEMRTVGDDLREMRVVQRLAARAGTTDRLQRTGWLKAYRTEAAFASAALESAAAAPPRPGASARRARRP